MNADYILSTAVDPQFYNLEALEVIFASTPYAAANLDFSWVSRNLVLNPNMPTLVPCLLRHGLNVNLGGGVLLCLAIIRENINLLNKLLSANPSNVSLKEAFRFATNGHSREFELDAMRVLLKKANSVEIGQSKALLQEIRLAFGGDSVGFMLLLHHEAVVDVSAFKKASLEAAASPLISNEKQAIFQTLLVNVMSTNGKFSLSVGELSDVLAIFVIEWPEFVHLPYLLIECGAQASLETLRVALETSPRRLFVALVNSTRKATTLQSVFKQAYQKTIVPDRRQWIYKALLDRDVPYWEISEALLAFLGSEKSQWGDMSCLKLLLEYDADVGHRKGSAFSLALHANSLNAVRLLSQNIANDHAATHAFRAFERARNVPLIHDDVRLGAYRCLLGMRWKIDKSLLNSALMDFLTLGKESNFLLLQPLLAKGADPNHGAAQCFVIASAKSLEEEFRTLSQYAKPSIILKALLSHFDVEEQVVRWSLICLTECSKLRTSRWSLKDELLFQCLAKFPSATTLLKLLLENGVSAAAKGSYALCDDWKSEECTALVWALLSRSPKIGNEVILTILAKDQDAGLSHNCY